VDYAGNQGDPSAEMSARTTPTYLLEAELLPVTSVSPGDSAYAQEMIGYGETWSNQAQLYFRATAIGDFVRQTATVAAPDSYDVAAYFTKGSNYGILGLKIDGQIVGDPVDLYAPGATLTRSSRIEFGTVYLHSGSRTLTYEVLNKNPASSGYNLGMDDILLTPHSLLGVVNPGPEAQPLEFRLYQNQPNPFNTSTEIRYQMPDARYVRLTVWDTAGRLVATLANEWQAPGTHRATFEGSKLASGIYFYRIEIKGLERSGKYQSVGKMLLLK
jgi:hypothetical protein